MGRTSIPLPPSLAATVMTRCAGFIAMLRSTRRLRRTTTFASSKTRRQGGACTTACESPKRIDPRCAAMARIRRPSRKWPGRRLSGIARTKRPTRGFRDCWTPWHRRCLQFLGSRPGEPLLERRKATRMIEGCVSTQAHDAGEVEAAYILAGWDAHALGGVGFEQCFRESC